MKLTEHFQLSEFVQPGVTPSTFIMRNIRALAVKLEEVRKQLGNKPMIITSGYRDPEHNKRVGGAPNSFHTKGMAADIVVKGMSAKEVQKVLHNWPGGMGLADGFTHLDIRNYKARWKY